jgi:hypothetical protein
MREEDHWHQPITLVVGIIIFQACHLLFANKVTHFISAAHCALPNWIQRIGMHQSNGSIKSVN